MSKYPIEIKSEIGDMERLYDLYLGSYSKNFNVPSTKELAKNGFRISSKQAEWYLKNREKVGSLVSGGMASPLFVSKKGLESLKEAAANSIESEKEYGFLWIRKGEVIEPGKMIAGTPGEIELNAHIEAFGKKGNEVAGSCHTHFVKEWEDMGPECQMSFLDTAHSLRYSHLPVETVVACTEGQSTAIFYRKRLYTMQSPEIVDFLDSPFIIDRRMEVFCEGIGKAAGIELEEKDFRCYSIPEKLRNGLYTTSYFDVPL